MNITIIGTGFVGVVSAAVFASLGNTVIGLDIDEKRIASLKKGKVPFYEPKLEELLVKTQQQGNLHFTTSYESAIKDADIIMIAVGTPSKPTGEADLKFVFSVAQSIAPYLKKHAIVAVKSTVPPGTCDKVAEKIRANNQEVNPFFMASLPEFLKEGSAVDDTLHPDRVVIGSTDPEAIKVLTKIHEPLSKNIIVMRPESAQMCKYTANAYLATRISFINQIADLCERNGADIMEVIRGIGPDKRIGSHYWYPGLGYGGSCFPKDVKELAAYAKEVGLEKNLMVTINELNEDRMTNLLEKYGKLVGGFAGKTVAHLGLSFKPNTDDMREAASTKIIPYLLKHQAVVQTYDPLATNAAKTWFAHDGISEGETLQYMESAEGAIAGADVIWIVVEWKELTHLDLEKVAAKAKPGAYFIDTRNQYERDKVEAVGLHYIGIGRP